MKPTRNQLLAAVAHSPAVQSALGTKPDDFYSDCGPITLTERFSDLLSAYIAFNPASAASTLTTLTSGGDWRLRATIKLKHETALPKELYETLQVPVEPFTDLLDSILALAWCVNEKHQCTLVPRPAAPHHLHQAQQAGLRINSVWTGDDGKPKLDPASVLLAFELCGLDAPRFYENWRLPDGDDCPSVASITADPDYGKVQTLYHNGMLALVSSFDGMKCKVVHVKALTNEADKQVRGFVSKNSKPKEPTMTEKEIERLANKYAAM